MTGAGAPTVTLRDIVTEQDREAALRVRPGPGQERFVATVEKSFADAIKDAQARPRYWAVYDRDEIVGFAMISDDVSRGVLTAEPDIIGPYFLWRLLIDADHQRLGYGTATLDAIVEYLRDRPGADVLWTSCGQGDGSPQPFYERYGFEPTDRFVEEERVMRLDLRARRDGRPA